MTNKIIVLKTTTEKILFLPCTALKPQRTPLNDKRENSLFYRNHSFE